MTAPPPAALQYPFATPPAPGEALEVAPRVLWVRMPLPFALDHINLWLLQEADGFTLVDCGYGDAATRELWERHFTDTLANRPIKRIIATHCHPDHLGNADWLSQRFGCAVAMAQGEYLAAHAIIDERASYSVRDICGLFRAHGLEPEHVAALEARGNRYKRGVPSAPSRFERLIAGDVLQAGGHAWRVIPGFGHSPEHSALHAHDAGVVISGDMLLPKISTNVAVWPSEPDGDPLARFLGSLTGFEALPGETLVLPSHGLPFRGISTRVAALRTHHAERLAELDAAVRSSSEPRSAADVVPVLFRRPLDLQQRYFAMGESIAHLNHLWHAGRLSRSVSEEGDIRFAA